MRARRPLLLSIFCGLLTLASCAGCATIGEPAESLVPTRYRTQTGPYAVFSSFPVGPESSPIRCLRSLESDVTAALGVHVPAEEPPVEVYILKDRSAFNHFLKFYFPDLPPRRAFFMAHGQRRVVYTYLGERLEEDLRHEATHALLNAAVGDLPLWLDEGLAEYFEGPGERLGFNPEHAAKLPLDLASGWKPDLARLETLKSVGQMTPRDYRESWAWAHYLLSTSNGAKPALLSYLSEVRTGASPQPLSVRLPGGLKTAEAKLLAYVQQVRNQPIATAPPTNASTVRFQDPPLEPLSSASRRGFFGRFRSWIGL